MTTEGRLSIGRLCSLKLSFPRQYILQITKAALNHVDNIEHVESITRNVRFDFVGFISRVPSIIATEVVNIGVCGAVPALAPKRTGGVARALLKLLVSGN